MDKSVARILVVDDTVVYRKIVSEILQSIDGFEVIASASNGKMALQKIEELRPDIVTLDLEMPVMDGLETLRQLRQHPLSSPPGIIMVSAFTADGANATVKALDLGAFDFILKPAGDDLQKNIDALRLDLSLKIRACLRSRQVRDMLRILPKPSATPPAHQPPRALPAPRTGPPAFKPFAKRPKVVALGISTGGPQALTQTLPKLPGDFPLPLLIVQHMPAMFTRSLAEDLNRRCALRVCEAEQGQTVLPGAIYIAPGGKQMKVHNHNGQVLVTITDDPPEHSCKPAVDYLFRSVAHCYDSQAIAVIMTGMGSDGTLGCRLLKRGGATIITQDEASCTVYGMPKAPADEGLSDFILPLAEIPGKLVLLTRQKVMA